MASFVRRFLYGIHSNIQATGEIWVCQSIEVRTDVLSISLVALAPIGMSLNGLSDGVRRLLGDSAWQIKLPIL